MFSSKYAAAAAALFSLIASTEAVFDAAANKNLAVYYGQGFGQKGLKHYCDQPDIDVIPIGFINLFPQQGNGFPQENFANNCWGGSFYYGPGSNHTKDLLFTRCPQLQEDIVYCQKNTDTKILLSLGGDSTDYQLTGVAAGIEFADFLWGAYGPLTAAWQAAGGVRPLDRGYDNVTVADVIDIDGFDLDIEHASIDQSAGYIALIKRLRTNFATNPSKEYLISGAPQCPLPEGDMLAMISAAKFDLLWVQFYNNGASGCTARNFTDTHAAGIPGNSGFNYDGWTTFLSKGASFDAKLYIGLLGDKSDSLTTTDYITAAEAKSLISMYQGKPNFGGVMIWEATGAESNTQTKDVPATKYCGMTYYAAIRSILDGTPAPGVCASTSTSTSASSTVTSKTVSSSTSTSTSSAVTTSTSASSTVTSKPVSSSTSTSTSSAVTTSISASSTVTSKTVSSSTSTSTSSAVTTSTRASSTVTSTTVSSSTSTPTSTAVTTTTSPTSASVVPTPTTVPSAGDCTYIGCYTEGNGVRALSGATKVDYKKMSVEICAEFCSGYALFGVEYGGECYCDNGFGYGSVLTAPGECNQVCDGTPTEFCGAGVRLDVYQCGPISSASSSATATSTSSSSSTSAAASTTQSSSSSSTESSSAATSPTASSTSEASSSSTSEAASSSTEASSSSTSEAASSSTSEAASSSTEASSSSTSSEVASSSTESSSESSSAAASSTSIPYPTSTSESSGEITSTPYPTATGSPYANTTSCTKSKTTSGSGEVTSIPYPVSTGAGPYSNTTSCTKSHATTTAYTLSTVYATSTYTVTSCAAYVLDCPASIGKVTTETVALYTTYCPVEATKTAEAAVSGPTKYTTSTVYATTVYTVTSCAETVTDCPARIGQVTTEVVSLYTTVCPVTETETAVPVPTTPAYPAYPVAGSSKTTTTSSTFTTYVTVYLVHSTATLVPYPTGPAQGTKVLGTAVPSVSVVYQAVSSAKGTASAYPTTPVYTGGAASLKSGAGLLVGVVAGLVLVL